MSQGRCNDGDRSAPVISTSWLPNTASRTGRRACRSCCGSAGYRTRRRRLPCVPSGTGQSSLGERQQVEDIPCEVPSCPALEAFAGHDPSFSQLLDGLVGSGGRDVQHASDGCRGDERGLGKNLRKPCNSRIRAWRDADPHCGPVLRQPGRHSARSSASSFANWTTWSVANSVASRNVPSHLTTASCAAAEPGSPS
jgi:hypothetical protein